MKSLSHFNLSIQADGLHSFTTSLDAHAATVLQRSDTFARCVLCLRLMPAAFNKHHLEAHRLLQLDFRMSGLLVSGTIAHCLSSSDGLTEPRQACKQISSYLKQPRKRDRA